MKPFVFQCDGFAATQLRAAVRALTVVGACMGDSVVVGARGLWKLVQIGMLVCSLQGPWVILVTWNATLARLRDSGWSEDARGIERVSPYARA
eukprot:3163958-Pyramimonas_sp.AAC.1